MAAARRKRQGGFTLIELMITVAIIGILASIAVGQYRDYTRRARMSEVLLAMTSCKTRVSESYLTLPDPPASGSGWGCEPPATSRYVSALQTSTDGRIRVTVGNLDPTVNGLYVHLVPLRADGTAMTAAADLGNGVAHWLCGSDTAQVRRVLPAECRVDTSAYASGSYD